MQYKVGRIHLLKPSDIDSAVAIIEQNYPDEQYGSHVRQEIGAMFVAGAIKPRFLICEDTAGG
jgi:hypothetical protein